MTTKTVQLETTTPEELVELMKQQIELLVMQHGVPLAKVSPLEVDERSLVLAALGDLVVVYPDATDDDFDEMRLMDEILEGTRGLTLSDVVIEERREGP